MKHPCGMIRDLVPLYLDQVCSEESKAAVAQHLAECAGCTAFCQSLQEAEHLPPPPDAALEREKAASFVSIRKRLRRKQVCIALAAVALTVLAALTGIGLLQHIEQTAPSDSISVEMTEGDLVGTLSGSAQRMVHIKRVESEGKTYLFFSLTNTRWDALVTPANASSRFLLCAAEKGADMVDAVYYFTGDDTGIESMDSARLQTVIDASVLLWHK